MRKADDSFKLKRGRAVLALLGDLGMLSTRSIGEFLLYGDRDTRLRETLGRLERRNLIRRAGRGAGAGREFHFQLRQDRRTLETVAEILGRKPEDFRQGNRRSCDAAHEDVCGRVHEFLRRRYPNSRVFRSWQYLREEKLEAFSFQSSEKMFLWPDLVFMPRACDFTPSPLERESDIFIAIEIENHLKSRARLVEKYLRLGNYSSCDGVLYLLPHVHWENTLREIYTTKALPDLYRIGHYGQTFLATGFYDDVQTDIGELPITPRLSAQNFHQWCAKLVATRFEDRRDPVTSHPGGGPG